MKQLTTLLLLVFSGCCDNTAPIPPLEPDPHFSVGQRVCTESDVTKIGIILNRRWFGANWRDTEEAPNHPSKQAIEGLGYNYFVSFGPSENVWLPERVIRSNAWIQPKGTKQ